MTDPQSVPKSSGPLDAAIRDLRSAIGSPQPAPAPTPPRPVAATAPPAPSLWGPSSQRPTSPIQLLVKVVKDAHLLKKQLEEVMELLTGEAVEARQRETVRLSVGLFPAIAQIAHEIERTHQEIAELLVELRGKL